MTNELFEWIHEEKDSQKWPAPPRWPGFHAGAVRMKLSELVNITDDLCGLNPQILFHIDLWRLVLSQLVPQFAPGYESVNTRLGHEHLIFDWNRVLKTWLAVVDDISTVDYILFYIVRHLPNDYGEVVAWKKRSRQLCLDRKADDLIETFVYMLGTDLDQDAEMLHLAYTRVDDWRVRDALDKFGFIQSSLQPQIRALKRGLKLFSCVRRHDHSAVKHLLRENADLTARNAEGETIFDYARKIGNLEALALLQDVQPRASRQL